MSASVSEVLGVLGLSPAQLSAVACEGSDVLVTAGAGSGKTRTLVARYIWHLARGCAPQQVVAITFTEKAAREMRNRVRKRVSHLAQNASDPQRKKHWTDLASQMDAARIGTIHSLCAEILRNHPAQAGLDPQFEVLDEGQTAAMQAQIAQELVAWSTGQAHLAPLFQAFSPMHLIELMKGMLGNRLEIAALNASPDLDASLCKVLLLFLEDPQIVEAIDHLHALQQEGELQQDAGDKLAQQVDELLQAWASLKMALASGEGIRAASQLFAIRRSLLRGGFGKTSGHARALVTQLREAYDHTLQPWLGGKNKADPAPDPAMESQAAGWLDLLLSLYRECLERYAAALQNRHALDFDGLEQDALKLLQHSSIQAYWRAQVMAVLVDEYQDTNSRQRQIVRHLTGEGAGRLFMVGDARQSIYRFRGADVGVFLQTEKEMTQGGGKKITLHKTYRAHAGLLRVFDDLLAAAMQPDGHGDDPTHVPYTSLRPHRDQSEKRIQSPYVEFVIGLGERAEEARLQEARALAQRLMEMRADGEIEDWERVALLFRASSGFDAYERALEAQAIPYVTIAGRGFFERPEIRDLLNILRALSEPWNDAAMAGLLRSPAIGMSDVGLYTLRWHTGEKRPLRQALAGDLAFLSPADLAAAGRARDFLQALGGHVDRLTVAELLKRSMDWLDYRAVMAASHSRLWRNVDKLLSDAHASGIVRVRAFFAYLQTLQDVGVRTGEAPVAAEGAVRLMTIHKAKGLEFDVVVLADAARQSPNLSSPMLAAPGLGLAVRMDRLQADGLGYRLAKWMDSRHGLAEEKRLLYVAATRAREKLLVSGHFTHSRGGWRARGWLKDLLVLCDLDPEGLASTLEHAQLVSSPMGEQMRILVAAPCEAPDASQDMPLSSWPDVNLAPLFEPLTVIADAALDEEQRQEPERAWRATGGHVRPPAAVVGSMVHEALHSWRFPDDPALEPLLEAVALQERLVDPGQRRRALREAAQLLARLRAHPRWRSMDEAEQRLHELPYARMDRYLDSGRIDLLVKLENGWHIVDFKTDELKDQEALEQALRRYRHQLSRYKAAVVDLMGVQPVAEICFLDAMGEVAWIEI